MGKLVVIEGLDGSGKATQTALLAEVLQQEHPVQVLSFPDYKNPSSTLVRMYLAGEFGTNPGDVNAYAASAFYAVDRYASFKASWADFYSREGLVLADRYTTSNAIHQCAKLPQGEWQAFVDWLYDFEYGKMDIPQPDLVICLDVDPLVSQQLLLQRYGEEDRRDIHEQDLEYLLQCRKAAHWCAGHLGWHMVVCSQDGKMKTREAIAQEILAIVQLEVL